MGLCVGSVCNVTGPNQEEGSARMMKMACNPLGSHGGEKTSDGFIGSGWIVRRLPNIRIRRGGVDDD